MSKKTETIITLFLGLILYVLIFFQRVNRWELTNEIGLTEIRHFFAHLLNNIINEYHALNEVSGVFGSFMFFLLTVVYFVFLWGLREFLTNLIFGLLRKFYSKI
jgi:hypothetical protein